MPATIPVTTAAAAIRTAMRTIFGGLVYSTVRPSPRGGMRRLQYGQSLRSSSTSSSQWGQIRTVSGERGRFEGEDDSGTSFETTSSFSPVTRS